MIANFFFSNFDADENGSIALFNANIALLLTKDFFKTVHKLVNESEMKKKASTFFK